MGVLFDKPDDPTNPSVTNTGGTFGGQFKASLAQTGANLVAGAQAAGAAFVDKVAPGLRKLVQGQSLLPTTPASALRVSGDFKDWRCKLIWPSSSWPSGNTTGLLSLLPKSGNDAIIVWPYTPQFQINYQASYETLRTLQTNYATPTYQHSEISSITINGEFTAGTQEEATYLYCVIHFLKSATKGFNYEGGSQTGNPPPVLKLTYLGDGGVQNMPVILQQFNVEYPKDVDYVATNFQKDDTGTNLKMSMVPSEMNINVTLMPIYSRAAMIKDNYSTTKFINGELIGEGYF